MLDVLVHLIFSQLKPNRISAALIALCMLCGCRSTLEEKGLLTPNAATSELFVTKHAGFVIHKLDKGGFDMHKLDTTNAEVLYFVTLQLLHPMSQPIKLEITFENPEDARNPLTATHDVAARMTLIDLKSSPVRGLKPAQSYEVIVRAYDSTGALLGSHRQLVHSRIGMRGARIEIFK